MELVLFCSICPFKNKYLEVLRAEFPGIEFVEGTHGAPGDESMQTFRHLPRNMLTAPKKYLPQMAMEASKQG